MFGMTGKCKKKYLVERTELVGILSCYDTVCGSPFSRDHSKTSRGTTTAAAAASARSQWQDGVTVIRLTITPVRRECTLRRQDEPCWQTPVAIPRTNSLFGRCAQVRECYWVLLSRHSAAGLPLENTVLGTSGPVGHP